MDTVVHAGLEPFIYHFRECCLLFGNLCDRERGICASPIRKGQMFRLFLIGSKNGAKHVVTLKISQLLTHTGTTMQCKRLNNYYDMQVEHRAFTTSHCSAAYLSSK